MGIPVAYAHLGYLSENGISTGYSLGTAYRNYVRAVEEGYTKARDSIIRIDEKAILLESGIGRRSATAFNDGSAETNDPSRLRRIRTNQPPLMRPASLE